MKSFQDGWDLKTCDLHTSTSEWIYSTIKSQISSTVLSSFNCFVGRDLYDAGFSIELGKIES